MLGYYNEYYAYVELTVDGKTARLFAPLSDVGLSMEAHLEEAAKRLAGQWAFNGGGNCGDDFKIFTTASDPTFYCHYNGFAYNWNVVTDPKPRWPEADEIAKETWGTWKIVRNVPEWGLYPEKVPYIVIISDADAGVQVFGVEIAPNELIVYMGDGGGSYVRVQ